MSAAVRSLLILFLLAGVFCRAEETPTAPSPWARHVDRNRKGEVCIRHIPQVEQKKNFCAPASVEMVLRYFDARLDQKKLGRLFESSRKRGTMNNEILEEFSKGKLKDFQMKELYNLFRNRAEYESLITAYQNSNMLSRRKKSKAFRISKRENPQEIFDKMEPVAARQAFAVQRAALTEQLTREVTKHIDAGIPMLWTVFMNLDPNERGEGGHMRLIVGYVKPQDDVTEVIYRDPWGAHARYKKMSMADACAITNGLFVVTPKSVSLP